MSVLESLEWRYATKKFDKNFQLSESQMNEIKKIIQLSPASYGLQPYKVLLVQDNELREKLKSVSYDQPQITDSSVVAVFVRKNILDETEVDAFVQNIVETRGIPKEYLNDYGAMMKYAVTSRTEDQKSDWVEKQIYLALGNLLTSLSVEKLDACPMEGFDKTQYNEILGLTDYSTVVVCAIGQRDESDEMATYKKVRKSLEELVEVI